MIKSVDADGNTVLQNPPSVKVENPTGSYIIKDEEALELVIVAEKPREKMLKRLDNERIQEGWKNVQEAQAWADAHGGVWPSRGTVEISAEELEELAGDDDVEDEVEHVGLLTRIRRFFGLGD
jgi:hypothetical protein